MCLVTPKILREAPKTNTFRGKTHPEMGVNTVGFFWRTNSKLLQKEVVFVANLMKIGQRVRPLERIYIIIITF